MAPRSRLEPAPGRSAAPAPGGRRAGAGRDRRAGGRRTRDHLMDVAEELFAEAGVQAVSIRSINAAAGLAPASVHYHFGDKDGLVRAIIARRGQALVERQAELLDEVEGRRRRPTAEDAVRLLADPLVELLEAEPVGGARWLAVIADLVATNDDAVYQVGFGPGSVQERINRSAMRAYPHQPAELVAERWRMATTALLLLIAGSANRTGTAGPPADDDVAAIVQFVASGLDGVLRAR